MALPGDLAQRLAEHVRARSIELGLQVVGDCSTSELAIAGGWILPRAYSWRDVDASSEAIFAATDALIEEVAAKHGPGRVWTLPCLEIVHPVYDDGVIVKLDRRKRPRVRLRALYYHEANRAQRPEPEPLPDDVS